MSKQFVIFKIHDEAFGVEITQVKEIIKPMEIFKVPNTPVFVEGLINLRDKVYTIFNLRKKFHMELKDFDENTKIIIVNINNLTLGFIVDEVQEIVKVEDEHFEDASSSLSSIGEKYLTGVARINNKIILLLDLSKLLSEDEHNEIKALSK